jgi:hypothetical protein
MAYDRSLPNYTTGTITGTSGSTAVTGTSTSWIATDAYGQANAVIGGDVLIHPSTGDSYLIRSVNSDTSITLWKALGSSISAGSSYNIVRNSPSPAGQVRAALDQVQGKGTTTAPVSEWNVDSGSMRARIGSNAGGKAEIAVGATGAAYAAMKSAITVDSSTGAVDFPNGVLSGLLSLRNRLRNANFLINQRGVSGTVTLSANAYGHDGVKAGASGATYTFAQSTLDTTLTITAGSIVLPVENTQMEGGTYTLSHAGTAQARIWQGSPAGSYANATTTTPLVTTGITGNINTFVEFSTGTVVRPQFEPGGVATAFERRPQSLEELLCYRYFYRWTAAAFSRFAFAYCDTTTSAQILAILPSRMRATPTVAQLANMTCNGTAATMNAVIGANANILSFNVTSSGLTAGTMTQLYVASGSTGVIDLSAEL